VQLVQPDSSFGTLSGTLHKVELGDLAFRNALNKQSFQQLEEMRPASKIKWEVSFRDIAAECKVDNTEDTLCITNGGKVCHMNDPVSYSVDEDMDVLFVSNRHKIPRIDLDTIAEANNKVVSEVRAKGDKFLFEELRARGMFVEAMRQERLSSFFKRVICFDELIKELSSEQNELAHRVAGFPTVAFTEPPTWDLNPFVPSAEDKASLESLKQALTDGMSKVNAEKGAMEMNSCIPIWLGSKPCACMEHAAESFNTVLGLVQNDVDVIVKLMEYIDLIKSAKGKSQPQAIFPQLANLVVECPYFRCSDQMKAILRLGNVQDPGSSEIVSLDSILKEQLREAQEMCDRERRVVDSFQERNKKFLMDTMALLNRYKKIVSQLQDALVRNGIELPVYESEIEEKKD